jgi:hypothetical protein
MIMKKTIAKKISAPPLGRLPESADSIAGWSALERE